jgi:hypothetical protein
MRQDRGWKYFLLASLISLIILPAASLWAAPNPASGLTATALSATQIRLDWTDNSTDETYFFIERKTGAGGTYTSIGNVGGNISTFTNTSLTPSTEYYYRVRVYNATGYSEYSNEVAATTLTLNAPTNLSASAVSYTQVTLTWADNSSEETAFSIERKNGAGGMYAPIATTAANATSYTNTGLTQGTEYYYRVRAVSGPNYSQYSSELKVTTQTLNPPSNVTVTPNSAVQIRLDWTDNSTDEMYFFLERKTGAGGTYTSIGNVGANVTTFTNTNLTQNAEYYYRVRAYNTTGIYSTYSTEASGTTLTLNAPTSLAAGAVSYTQVTLAWADNSSEETSFSIERKTGAGGTYAQVATTAANATSYTTTGLTQGTEYYFRVRAISGTNNSQYSNEVNATTLTLNAPSNLTVTPLSAVQIRLDWTDNSTDEMYFFLERKTGAGGTYASIGNVGANVTIFANTGLTQGTEYYYRIRAYNNTGNYSVYSNEASATTSTLNAPTSLAVGAVSYAQITIGWTDNSSEETGFSIERKTGAGGTYAQVGSVGANVTTFTNTSLTQGTEYYFRVRAISGANYSGYSTEVNATTLTLNAPSSLTVTPLSATQIRLDWTDNSTDETNFYIERKTGAGGTYAYVGTVGANVTTYTSAGLTQNTTYYYRVSAYNGGNYSVNSNEASAITSTMNAPTGLAVGAVSYAQVTLAWTDNSSEETGFSIERKTGASGAYAQVATTAANATSYTNTSLTQGTEYYFRVRAVSGANYSGYSNEVNATTLTLNAPSSLTVTPMSATQVRVDWTDNSTDETNFYIERKTGAGGTYAYVGNVGANITTFTNTSLTQGTEYYYRVRAYNGGNYSVYSNEANAATSTLAAPSNLNATATSSSQITLTWADNSSDETSFSIERKTGAAGTYVYIGGVGANITTFTSTGLTQGTEYYYRVRTVSGSNYSEYSNEVSATPVILAPSNLSVGEISTSQIALTWTDNSNEETGFSIERKTGDGGTYAQVGSVSANVTTFTNTGLTQGTEYYYRVRTVSGSNYSKYSNEVSATPSLLPPSNLVATPLTPSEIVLSWNDNSGDETVFYIDYRAEGTDIFTTLTSVSANTTAYIHKTLTPGTTYHYRVRAYGLVGYSPYSNEAGATTPAAVTQGASDSAGAEFFVAFQPNTAAGISNLSLFITGKQDTLGVVEIPGLNFTQVFAVQANKVTTVTLPSSAQSLGTNNVAHLGVRVAAQNEITVYGLNQKQFTTDAFSALPVDILGLEYLTMSYQSTYTQYPSQVAVVGVYDNTQVTITPSAAATGRSAGVPFTITLNRQDTFQLTGSGTADLTGSIITASVPVAVMSGVDCANVPVGVVACDHIVEMMPPVTTWGKSFLTVPLATRLKGDVFRILASQDNTTVYLNGVLETTLNRGKFLEKVLTARTQIEASAPVLVAQYSPGQSFDNVVSDPFMMLIPPTEQFLNQYTLSTPATGFTANFVNIVVPSTAISSLRLDGASIDTTLFSSIGSSGFSGAQVPVALGSHAIIGDVPFGIYVYGFGSYDSYGYPGGMAFQFINPIGDAYPPNIRLIKVGDSIQGTATDSEDINANGILDPGEDLNHNGVINRRSEDVNGNGVLDPGEDLNENGHLDRDTGIFKVELAPGSTNLQLTVTPFIPGALSANFTISLLDPDLTGTGTLRVSDGVGNMVEKPIFLSKYSVLKDVRIIDTIATQGIEVDAASFSKTPYSITTSGASTVIEWRFDYFPVNLTEGLGFDVIMKTPVNGEHRLVSQKLELHYTDVNGNQVRTELGPQYVNVLNSAFDSAINTDKPAYQPNENVNVSATIKNLSGYARIINAKVQIEDLSGTLVKEVGILSSLSFNPNEVKTFGNLIFNTGSTYAGEYRAHLILYENQKQIGETFTNFQIQRPTNSLSSRATVDKVMYNPNENATITSLVTSLSSNYIFENLTGRISIRNPIDNSQLFTDTKNIITLMPGAGFSFKAYWNTGTYAAGSYPVTLEVRDSGGALISTATNAITITSNVRPSTQLRGQISVDKQSIMTGETVTASYSVTNSGNVDLSGISLAVRTINLADETVYNTIADQAALVMGASYTKTGLIDTTAYSAKDYLVVLMASINGVEETLASTYFRVEGAPSAPALISPANGADVDTFTPALTVSNASDPNDDKLTYEFEIYSDNGLANLVNSSGAVAETAGSTAWTVSAPLTENLTYFWRARAWDGKLYGPWMETASFRVNTANDPPTAPIISSPVDNGVVSSLTPAFTVLNATDPDSPSLTYNFDLALDSGFTQIVSSITGIAEGTGTTSWQIPVTLNENMTYYWRSQADDWIIEGPWSTTGRFFVNTVNEPPSIPVIIAPVKGASLKALEADITVQNSTDPDSPGITYTFELDTVMSFDSPIIIRSGNIQQGQNGTTWHVTGLTEDTQYYVRAKASDGQAESAWSGIVDFFTNATNSAPTAPTLANPSNGAGVTVFTPILSVHNSTDPDRDILTYEFEVYADAALTTLVTNIAGVTEASQTTSWTVPVTLTENKTYYWQARASDGNLQSSWMAQSSFTINTANDAPGAPVLLSPANGSTIATLTPALVITNAKDPDNDKLTYEYEVYQGSVLVTSITNVPENGSGETSATLAANLADNTVYQWRVRAFDGDRYGPWTAMASFTVHTCQHKLKVDIDFEPETLNKKDCGKWVVVKIELPHGYRAKDVDISSIRLEGTVHAEPWPHECRYSHHEHGCDHDRHGHNHEVLMVKFKRSEVIAVLPEGRHVPVHVTGMVGTTQFEGVDVIRVTSSGHCCGGH